ncbi:MAG TPA: hypothetical protein VHB72_01865 [Candidatus Saccharimonadales bacterium]|nr:hypothetical protein [Candidatus Saccharimonadales bacterium]
MINPDAPAFYEQHQDKLPRLFEIAGAPPEAAATLETAVEATQPWVRGDHIKPEQRFQINPADEPELHELYSQFGLVREHPLLARHYDELLMLGGTYWGNHHRMRFLKQVLEEGGITTDRVTLLGGERKIFTEEIVPVQDDLNNMGNGQLSNLEKGAGGTNIHWETDMLRLAAVMDLGNVVVEKAAAYMTETGEYARPHIQEFSWRDVPFALMHAQAVERNGAARHTTESCMADWLETTGPKSEAVVGFIAANPHTTRVARSAYGVLRKYGRDDIALVPAGPAVLPTVKNHTYLGEIGRHLYEDMRLRQTGSGLAAGTGISGEPSVIGQ